MSDLRSVAERAALLSADTRLYRLRGGGCDALMVERWQHRAELSTLGDTQITAVATAAGIDLPALIGQAVTLVTILADGTEATRTGLIRDAESLDSDGGLARYRLTVVPWLWYTTLGRHNRVFQDKTVLEIIEQVWADYRAIAAWQFADHLGPFLADVPPRRYCVQYRESDYAFVARLLAEEGIGYTFVEDDEAPAGHAVHLFADTADLSEDATAAAHGGIRFHRASSQEQADTIQHFGGQRQMARSALSLTSPGYQTKRSISTHTPTVHSATSDDAPALESYDDPGQDSHATAAEAERYGRLAMQASEARTKHWLGRSTVRSLRCATHFTLTQSNLDLGDLVTDADDTRDHSFTVLSVTACGINNLPSELARRSEPPAHEQPTHEPSAGPDAALDAIRVDPELWAQAQTTGYANHFTAIRRRIPWRPVLADATGQYLNPRPTAPGPQTATVVGPNGQTTPSGADELYTDALGRIKVRFHWQQGHEADDRLSCWLRVAQRHAGAGMGSQFMPRIGQEVLVQFLAGDIDQPIVTGALYNGQGEAGVPATPGGQQQTADHSAYADARDHKPAAQANRAGGHSPAWHGGAPDAHRNAAALSGYKSAEFGGPGHNRLVFDDTNNQQRSQLATTHAHSQLNLGHLIHQADNYRGSLRGTGFELRTDAYGAVRGERGVLLATYPMADQATPAGDFSAGNALLKQSQQLGQAYSDTAQAQHTAPLAAHQGSHRANQAIIDTNNSPLAALLKTAQGQVTAADWHQAQQDADDKHTAADKDHLPHSTDPILAIAAKAGIGVIAGQDLHHHAGETLTVASGQDHNLAVNNQYRLHTGQAIGLLAGSQTPGDGLQLTAGDGDIDLQAQSDHIDVKAQDDLTVISHNAEVEFAAQDTIHLATAGGASVTIEGGEITINCPGQLTVHASNKVFTGGAHMSRAFNSWPQAKFDDRIQITFPSGQPATNYRYEYVRADGAKIQGITDGDGWADVQRDRGTSTLGIRLLGKADGSKA